ncbi:hypothetical protein AAMO2058_001267400 [Amorphochlora amoebiformis]
MIRDRREARDRVNKIPETIQRRCRDDPETIQRRSSDAQRRSSDARLQSRSGDFSRRREGKNERGKENKKA